MKKGESFKYLGYEIKKCVNNDGIVLIDPKGTHCGNFGDDVPMAKQFALINYMMDKPVLKSLLVNHLAGSDGHWGEYDLLCNCIKKDGFEIPSELKMTDDMNRMIANLRTFRATQLSIGVILDYLEEVKENIASDIASDWLREEPNELGGTYVRDHHLLISAIGILQNLSNVNGNFRK